MLPIGNPEQSLISQTISWLEKIYNSIRYNGFYIFLSLIFPFIIWRFDAGREIIVSMTESDFNLNIPLTIVTFMILGVSIWCIPTLAISFFLKIFSQLKRIPKIKYQLFEQLIQIYNGTSRQSEEKESAEKLKEDSALPKITRLQISVRYLSIAPWFLFVMTCIKVFSRSNIIMILIAILLIFTIVIIHWKRNSVFKLLDFIYKKGRFRVKYRYIISVSLFFILAFLLYITLKKYSFGIGVSKYLMILFNIFCMLAFYTFIYYMENGNLTKDLDKETARLESFSISNVSYITLLIYLVLAILTLYIMDQKQWIQEISPVIVIITLSAALIAFAEFFFTAQFLLVYLAGKLEPADTKANERPTENALKVYKYALIFFLLLIVNLYFFSSGNSHRIRKIAAKERIYTDSSRLQLKNYFEAWWNAYPRTAKDSTIYLVSGQGGGSRAAAWFMMNMAYLEAEDSSFYKKVFSFSTVSGSTSGANMYLASKFYGHQWTVPEILQKTKKIYGVNYMSSAFFGMLLGDGIESVVDHFEDFPRDRNFHLQEEERRSFEKAFEKDSLGFFIKDYMYSYSGRATYPPLFLINTAIVDFGTRGIFSPVQLESVSYARDLYKEFKKDNCNSGYDIPMVTCVNQSQAFPILSAYNYMECVGRFVDGGLYDNSGCTSTLEFYEALRKYLDTTERKHVRIVCLNLTTSNLDERVNAPYKNASILNTITAAANAPFSGHQTYAYNDLKRQIRQLSATDTVVDFSLKREITLTRTLSNRSVEDMWNALVEGKSKGLYELPKGQ